MNGLSTFIFRNLFVALAQSDHLIFLIISEFAFAFRDAWPSDGIKNLNSHEVQVPEWDHDQFRLLLTQNLSNTTEF